MEVVTSCKQVVAEVMGADAHDDAWMEGISSRPLLPNVDGALVEADVASWWLAQKSCTAGPEAMEESEATAEDPCPAVAEVHAVPCERMEC